MMITDELRRKLKDLGLDEMLKALEIQSQQPSYESLPFEERLRMLVDYTYQEKYAKRVERQIKQAKLCFPQAEVDDIYYENRYLDRQNIQSIASCQFMQNNTNLIVEGLSGTGKSYLACAIGKEACRHGYQTFYIRIPDLLQLYDEAAALSATNVLKLLKKYESFSLLILDEWLMDELTQQQISVLYELIERRYTDTSMVFCTQYPLEDWPARLGGDAYADSIIDRIIHNSIQLYAGDINMREIEFKI